MTVVDFHPDDLLDRRARGLLAPDEHKRLHEHLQHCAVCRLELQVRQDFRAEFAPYAESATVQRFVLDALSAAGASSRSFEPPQEDPFETRELTAPKGKWRRRLLTALTATFLLVTGLAAAQYTGVVTGMALLARRLLSAGPNSAASTPPVDSARRNGSTRDAPAMQRAHVSAEHGDSPSTAAPVGIIPSDEAMADARGVAKGAQQRDDVELQGARLRGMQREPTKSALSSSRQQQVRQIPGIPASSTSASMAAGDAVGSTAPEESKPEQTATGEATQSAASKLFAQANLARRQGRWAEASGLYRELRTRHAESAEARLSIVLSARMQLDQGDATAALRGFDAYLASSDESLREEALTGRCMALQKLGRQEEERAAVRRLLAMYPDSPYARKAEKRLGAEAGE
jgi:TolA-binding protein